MHSPFVVSELVRKNPTLIKARVYGFVVLPAVILPPEVLHQHALCRLLVVIQIIEQINRSRPMRYDVEDERGHWNEREIFEPLAGKLLVNAVYVAAVPMALRPLANVNALRSKIYPADVIPDAVFARGVAK